MGFSLVSMIRMEWLKSKTLCKGLFLCFCLNVTQLLNSFVIFDDALKYRAIGFP